MSRSNQVESNCNERFAIGTAPGKRRPRISSSVALGTLTAIAVATPPWAANDPKDLPSQNAEDASVAESTGQLHFKIEIPTPKGTGGSEPVLSLAYSSDLSDGPFGVGWRIELGEIRRSARKGTPAYASGDEFELDGALLVEDHNNLGEYRTLQDSFARITRAGDSWTVEFPNGSIARFGSDQSTRIRIDSGREPGGSINPENDSGEIGRWLLSELEDAYGNVTKFSYDRSEDVGTAYPNAITYSYRDGALIGGVERRIEFVLEDRVDPIYGFPAGLETRVGKRVKEIRSLVDGEVYRRLALSYVPIDAYATDGRPGRTRLESTQLFGTDCAPDISDPRTGCTGLPAKTFTYTDSGLAIAAGSQWDLNAVWAGGSEHHFTQGAGFQQGRDRGVRIADINGDGFPDFVRAIIEATASGSWASSYEVYLSNGDGWGVLDTAWGARLEELEATGNFVREKRHNAKITCSAETVFATDLGLHVFFRTENPFNWETHTVQPNLRDFIPPIEARLVDINGDGLADIVLSLEVGAGSVTANTLCSGGANSWAAPVVMKHVWINTGSSSTGWVDATTEWAASLPPFNSIYLRTDSGTGAQTPGRSWTPGKRRGESTNISNGVTYAYFFDHGVRMPDLNGDGRPDIVAKRDAVTFGEGSPVIEFEEGAWLSDPSGTGWTRDDNYLPPVSIVAEFNYYRVSTAPIADRPKYVTDADAGVRFADLNGDGLADLVKTAVAPLSAAGVNHAPLGRTLLHDQGVWLNTGDGWCGPGEGNAECDAAQKYMPPAGFTTIDTVYQPPAPSNAVHTIWAGGNLPVVRSSELHFVDLNGDGMVDLLKTDSPDLTGMNAWIHDPSDPNIWVSDALYIPPTADLATINLWVRTNGDRYIADNGVRIYDYNGDATVDLLRNRAGQIAGEVERIIAVSRSAQVDLLKTLDNGQGGRQEFAYTSAIAQRDPAFEAAATTDSGPEGANEADQIGIQRWTARPIVSMITTRDTLPGGATHSTSMFYALPMWDPATRSQLGFRGVKSVRDDGSSKLTYFWQAPGRTGRPHRVEIFEGNDLKQRRKQIWEVVSGSAEPSSIAGVNIGRLVYEESANYYRSAPNEIAGPIQSVTYSYSPSNGGASYGYNFVHHIGINRPTGALQIERTAEAPPSGKWIIGKLDKEIYTDDDGNLLKETEFDYDRGLPTLIKSTAKLRYVSGTSDYAQRVNLYDPYGNLRRTTDAEGRITEFCYDGDTVFANGSSCPAPNPTSTFTVLSGVRDPIGEITAFVRDLASGDVRSVNRQYSGDWEYIVPDRFGRAIQHWIIPRNLSPHILATRDYFDDSYDLANLAGRPYVVERNYFERRTNIDDDAAVRTARYLDGFGRVVASASPKAPNQLNPFGRAVTDRDYAGRPLRATLDLACTDADCTNLPTDAGIEKVTLTYDALGRILTRKTPDGVVAFAYSQKDPNLDPASGLSDIQSLDEVLAKDPKGNLTQYLLDGDRLVVVTECTDSLSPLDEDLSDNECTTGADPVSTVYTYEPTGEIETIYDASEAGVQNFANPAHQLTYRYDTLGRVWLIEDPDGGTKYTTYDLVGNVKTTDNLFDAFPAVEYDYDALNRVDYITRHTGQGDWNLDIAYDARTRKRSMVTSTGTYTDQWLYDDFGNLTANIRTMNDRTLRTDFTYDLLGRLTSLVSPLEGSVGVTYDYDGAYLVSVCSKLSLATCERTPSFYHVQNAAYDAIGRITKVPQPPGDLEYAYYSSSDQETGEVTNLVKSISLSTLLDLTYHYDLNENVMQVSDEANTGTAFDATALYDYDTRNRIHSWRRGGESPKYFAYDRLGNLRGRNLDSPATSLIDDPLWDQAYADLNRPHAITQNHKGKNYDYDAAGNVTQRGNDHFTYNSIGQIACVGESPGSCSDYYWYDIDGKLLSKTTPVASEIFVGDYFRFDKNSNIAWISTSAFGKRIVLTQITSARLRDARVAGISLFLSDRDLFIRLMIAVSMAGTLWLLIWLVANHVVIERPITAGIAITLSALIAAPQIAWAMGVPRGSTVKTRYLYHDHLGSEVLVLDRNANVMERRVFEPFGEVIESQSEPAVDLPTSFTGKLHFDESSLYNFGARWYDSEAGRFVSIDPILQFVSDPQTHNPYGYVRNNPVSYVDPDGREIAAEEGNHSFAASITFAVVEAVNFLFSGGGSNEPAAPRPPQNLPDNRDVVIAGNAGIDREGSTRGVMASTAKQYGDESQSGADELGIPPVLTGRTDGPDGIRTDHFTLTSQLTRAPDQFAHIDQQIAGFESQVEPLIRGLAALFHAKDSIAVPLFISGTGLTLVGAGVAISGAAITGGSLATGPGAGLLAPAGLFIAANGVAITAIGGSIAFGTINNTFGTNLPTFRSLPGLQ